jgi:hypothetical protein
VNPPHARPCERDAQHAADKRQRQRFGQQLPDDLSPRSAKRRADRQLALAGERAREQEIADVRARDQEHERHRGREHDDRRPHIADHLFVERNDRERQAAVRRIDVGMIAPQARGDRVHLRLRGVDRHAALEAPDDVVVLARASRGRRRRQRERQEDLAVLCNSKCGQHLPRQAEGRGKHARDLIRLAVQDQRLSHRARVAAEPPLPESVAQDRRARPPRGIVFGHEQLAVQRLRAEHWQQIR